VNKALAAGVILALMMTALPPVLALAEETSSSESDEAEYVEGGVEEEMVGGLRLARGKHGRKVWRATRWVDQLTGDKARVFDAYGMPSSRYREEVMGRVQEMWTYQEQGLEITFEGGKIVRTKEFIPAKR